jgi:hypothetical protein
MAERKKHLFHLPKTILLAGALLVSACIVVTAPGPLISSLDRSLIEPRGELGQLVITRYPVDGSTEKSPKILVDGQEVADGGDTATCYKGGVIIINLPAGTYKITQADPKGLETEIGDFRKSVLAEVTQKKRTYMQCGYSYFFGRTKLSPDHPRYWPKFEQSDYKNIFEDEHYRLSGIYELK